MAVCQPDDRLHLDHSVASKENVEQKPVCWGGGRKDCGLQIVTDVEGEGRELLEV